MAFNIKARGASETGTIELKAGDGSPLNDDAGNVLSVTVHSPASKQWEAAQAAMNRKRAERLRKNGGKLEAALDNAKADQVTFLTAITIRFNGDIEHPDAENSGDLARAIYEDDTLGFIRDHVFAESGDWASFTGGSAKS